MTSQDRDVCPSLSAILFSLVPKDTYSGAKRVQGGTHAGLTKPKESNMCPYHEVARGHRPRGDANS